MATHYANLTNGIMCAPIYAGFVSIPIERNSPSRIARGAGADLLAMAAMGEAVVVHDQFDYRPRAGSYARWLTLSWLRYACSAAWGLELPVEVTPSGVNITRYWERAWKNLPGGDKAWLATFARYAGRDLVVDLSPCACPAENWLYGE